MSNGKILFVIAYEGFQQVEYNTPKEILENAGYKIVTASDQAGTATAKDGSQQIVDITLDKVKANDYHGVFFIGGPGALDHLDNAASYRIIREAAASNLPFGAICISTRILAKAGALKGKHATGWDGDNQLESIYQPNGVIYQRENVVQDAHIVTATDPSAAKEFGERILAVLQDHKGWG